MTTRRHLAPELGCSPATAHRRLQEWERAGVWPRLHRELIRRLNAAGRLDWSAGVIDGSQARALQGACAVAPRRRPDRLLADRAHDHDQYRRELRAPGVSRDRPPARPSTCPGVLMSLAQPRGLMWERMD